MAERPADARDPEASLALEWLATNGLGGYAMGTALGANTRRYHGLLVAALRPPVGRALLLHSVIEQIIDGDEVTDLATHEFAQASLHPEGWRHLVRFSAEPPTAATWLYSAAGIGVRKHVRLSPERNEVVVRYELSGVDRPVMLRLRPLTPLRGFHDLVTDHNDAPKVIAQSDTTLVVSRADRQLTLEADDGDWRVEPEWWRGFVYREDRRRGQTFEEDVWSPGVFEAELHPGETNQIALNAWATPSPREGTAGETPGEGERKETPVTAPTPQQRLRTAADQFIVRRAEPDRIGFSVIAGYPWFADWGRDAMICVPGLLLASGRLLEAGSALRTFARHLHRGIIPNRFDDRTSEPHYNTVDASLWFINAVYAYTHALPEGQRADAADLVDTCRSIINAYRTGHAPGVSIGVDGLVSAGTLDTQLTWMDAMRDGTVFTSRHGRPIEINALWYNALQCLAELSDTEREQELLRELAGQLAIAVQMAFWWAERRCCHDVLTPDGEGWHPDGKLRPNQIIAVSLPFGPLTALQERDVVDVVRERLLTPFGLRSLDPDDPDYRGRYEGDMTERDAAYHQGTVWPWLMGPFGEAVLRVNRFSEAARADVGQLLEPLLAELDSGCIGQLAEVYDGDPPHRPSGCPAQAWSVAEVLRLLDLVRSPRRDRERIATLKS